MIVRGQGFRPHDRKAIWSNPCRPSSVPSNLDLDGEGTTPFGRIIIHWYNHCHSGVLFECRNTPLHPHSSCHTSTINLILPVNRIRSSSSLYIIQTVTQTTSRNIEHLDGTSCGIEFRPCHLTLPRRLILRGKAMAHTLSRRSRARKANNDIELEMEISKLKRNGRIR